MVATERSRVSSVLIGVVGFYVIFSVMFVVGRAFTGSTRWVPLTAGGTLAEELRNELLSNADLAAVVIASGGLEERIELHAVELLPRRDWPYGDPWSSPAGLVLLPGDYLPDLSGLPAFVGARFSGSGYALTVDAGEVAVGGEWSPVGSTVLTDPTGRSFFATRGECSIRVWRAGWTTESMGAGTANRVVRSSFLAELRCVDIPEIRSGSLLSLVAAIRYEP